MHEIFRLTDVQVEFHSHAIGHRTLKDLLAGRGGPRKTRTFRALDGINLQILPGEHIGLIGRNGAGKSTLLRVLTGVIEPQNGIVFRNQGRHMVPLLELGVGFHPDLSGRENCYLAGTLMGYTTEEIRARIPGIIRFSELDGFIDEPTRTYSSGMYARLAFALATDIEPDVLLIDEVFGVGDEFFMRKCIVRMQNLMRGGTTTILVSHNADFLVAQCDRLIWLDQGRILRDGMPADVVAAYRSCR